MIQDTAYIQSRNKLIPVAEELANSIAGKRPKGNREKWATHWNSTFHKTMDKLARAEKLIN